MTLSSLSTPIIPKNQESVRIFCIFFDLRCKDRYKTNFLLSNNAQKFILQSRSSKMGREKNPPLCFIHRGESVDMIFSKDMMITKIRCAKKIIKNP